VIVVVPPVEVPVLGETRLPVVAPLYRLRRIAPPLPPHAVVPVKRVKLPVQPVELASKLNE
jgi:hypothetical protein